MSKWEYKTINIEGKWIVQNLKGKEAEKILNEFGADGWELVSAIPITRTGSFTKEVATYAFSLIFKRPC